MIGVVIGSLITTIGAIASTAPIQVAASGLALIAIFLLLWRRDDPPVLLLPPLFQWSEVAIIPFSTIWKRGELNNLSITGANLDSSAIYGLFGVVALALGLRLGMGRLKGFGSNLRAETLRTDFASILHFSLTLMVAGYIFAALKSIGGPLHELFNQLSGIKNVGLFMFAYWCLAHQQHISILVGIIAIEVLFGMTGFFADFKGALLTLIIAAMAARPNLKARDLLQVGISLTLLVFVATFWTVVKSDYRSFVNKGSGDQVVLVPITARVSYLTDAINSLNTEVAVQGFDNLVARHGYIDYLARVMENVPRGVPHENGALTAAVVQHIAMPRFLFPGKPSLPNDTEVMAHYTGESMVWNANTSISIGHLGELYIDFGYFGGLIGMLTIGTILGRVYRVIRNNSKTPALLSTGLCLMVALPVAYFGTAYPKLIGAMIASALIAIAFQRYLAMRLLSIRWLRISPRT